MIITIPSGVQIFCWIATLWGGKLNIKTPLLFVFGFFAIFIIGGLTGVMLASVPLDLQIHDTFFVVAHLHYVLIGGSVFPLFGAFYYWFPKWTGRMLSENAGRWNFALMFIGFNLVFFPMHQLGLNGMPRRVYTYLPETGWGTLNLIASIGAFILAGGVLVFIINFFGRCAQAHWPAIIRGRRTHWNGARRRRRRTTTFTTSRWSRADTRFGKRLNDAPVVVG